MNPIHNGVPQTLTARWRHRAYSAPPTRNLTLKTSVPRPGVPRPYPPSRPFRAAHLRVGNESSRSISCPTHLHWEWTVRHRPYRLQRIGRWVTIASDCHHPPSWSFRAAHLPVGIEASRSARNTALSQKAPHPSQVGLRSPVRTYVTRRFRRNRLALLLRVPFFREFSSPSRSSPQTPSSSPCRDCWVLQPVGRWRSGLSDPNPNDYFERSLSTSNCGVPSRVKLTRIRPLALDTSVWNSFGVRTGS